MRQLQSRTVFERLKLDSQNGLGPARSWISGDPGEFNKLSRHQLQKPPIVWMTPALEMSFEVEWHV